MIVLDLLYALLIGPLELFFEILYSVAYRFLGDPGFSIIFLSLAMNFLVLPLYRRADAMQEAERDRAEKMKPGTDHIKKTFKGDERFMILQTFNRQNNYKPTDALKGSVSLLLEIPFFIAAYNFLSNLPLLHGVSFGPIADLGAPDALLQIGDVSVNVLPIIMTAINLVSAFIYMKGMPVRNKVQTYGIAAIFLVLLYNSPAGLVFYWTLNNLFSLVKNVFYKLKDPKLALSVVFSVIGVIVLVVDLFVSPAASPLRQVFIIGMCIVLQAPLATRLIKRKVKGELFTIREATKTDTRAFVLCGLALAIITGALIPLSVIQSSPAEFVNVFAYESPLMRIARSLALGIGVFVIWAGVFYWLATPKSKTVFGCAMFALVVVAVVDYLCFGLSLGNLSPSLQFEGIPQPGVDQIALNLAVVAVIIGVCALIWKFKGKAVFVAGMCMCIATAAISVFSAVDIEQNLRSVKATAASIAEQDGYSAPLSKNGKNVVILMMDRAISQYIPYMLNEKPELKEKMAGFTFYSNTTSYGLCTNIGSPGLYGGYDYVPERMNARSDTPLVEKQNEALKVMPSLFVENGYQTTFFDPTYAGYSWVPDLSVFDGIPGMRAFITSDDIVSAGKSGKGSPGSGGAGAVNGRDFFCYSLFKISPVFLQPTMYHGGDYNSARGLGRPKDEVPKEVYDGQVREGATKGHGFDGGFMRPYSILGALPELIPVKDDDRNTFTIFTNEATHNAVVLKEPEYEPEMDVDNTLFDEEHRYRYTEDGNSLEFPPEDGNASTSRLMHYEVNMAALKRLCDWFDYLRENDAYDNTRIIIVSDHGRDLRLDPNMIVDVDNGHGKTEEFDLLTPTCLLLVKDFDSKEFTVDDRFMTNADTPVLAMKGLIDNPVNPFSGNPIDSSAKDESDPHILFSWDWDTAKNNGNSFLPGYWFSIHDDVSERDNWEYLGYY